MQMISLNNYYERKRVRDKNKNIKRLMYQVGYHKISLQEMTNRKQRRRKLSSNNNKKLLKINWKLME